MALKASILCTCALILSSWTSSMADHEYSSYEQPIKGVYFPSWVNFDPSAINTKLFTHIYYAFLSPNSVTFKFDIEYADALMLVNFTSTLHAKNPPVKLLFSVGGAAEGTAFFSRMAQDLGSRSNFINSSIEVARKFGFDGIDLDWEFPEKPKDMENLGHLLEEWRVEVQKEAAATGRPPLLLSAAVYYSADGFLSGPPRAYPSDSVSKNLDWINVMNYDYHGAWDKSATGAQAALFDPKSNVSSSYGLESWIRSGVPRSKLIMGLPMYGRTWTLKDHRSDWVGAPAIDVGPGPNKTGVLTYAEVLKFNRENKAKVVYDLDTFSPYSVSGRTWIGYDDKQSVMMKIGYARFLGLRGYFFWAIHGDYKWELSKTGVQSFYKILSKEITKLRVCGLFRTKLDGNTSSQISKFDSVFRFSCSDAFRKTY